MLEFFRRHSKIVMIILFIVVVPSLVFFGVADYQSFSSTEKRLVTVNEQAITQAEFERSWTERLNELRQRQGLQFDLSAVDTPFARKAWLERLIDIEVIREVTREQGFLASDAMVRDALAKTPDFFENGQFSMAKYDQFLTQNRITSQQYEGMVRAQESIGLVLGPVVESAVFPSSVSAALTNGLSEEREVRLREFAIKDYLSKVEVSDETLKTWYEQHSALFEVPAYVNVDYLLVNQEAAISQVRTPEEADLEAYYQSNKGRFGKAERRHLKHIQVADLQTAEQLAVQLKQDSNAFDELVKTYSIDEGTKQNGGDLGIIVQGEVPELAPAFALTQTGISDPVNIDNAYHIFYVVNIEPANVQSFDEVKAQLIEEVRLQLAAELFAKLTTTLTEKVHEQTDNLKGVADSLGMKLETFKGVTPQGLLSAEQLGEMQTNNDALTRLFTLPRVREVLFSSEVFQQGLNSGVIEISPSEFLVLRVNEKVERHLPAFEQVEPSVRQAYTFQEAKKLAVQAGEQALTQESSEGFGERQRLSYLRSDLPQTVIDRVMSASVERLPNTVGIELPTHYLAVRIEAVQKDNEELKQLFTQFQAPLLHRFFALEVEQAFTRQLRQKVKVTYLPDAQKVIEGEQQP